MMKKMLAVVFALVMVTTGMVFAGGQQESKDGYTIGYSQHWGTITYARVVMLGAVEAAAEWSEKLGVEVKVKGTDSGMDDPSIQANDIQDLYAQGVDGLMLFAGDAKIVGQAVKNTFNKDGAPVVVTDTGMVGADYICHVTTDNYSAGKVGAESLKGVIPANAKVIAFNGSPGIDSVNKRVLGYEETCVALGYELLPTKTCKVSVEEGKQLMEDMLVSEPDIAAVFTTNIDTAIGASSALKNAGNTTCHIIAFDLNDVAYKMVKDGEIYALVIQDPYFMGYEGLNQIMYSLTGETSKIKKNIGAPAHVMTIKNAADFADNPALTL
jgi:ribose transport system substrate-binding protein